MEIKNVSNLHAAIDKLKLKEKIQKELLVENFHTTYEGFKPANLIKKSIFKLLHMPEVKQNLVNTTVGLGAGLLSKKILIGKSSNFFKRMLGMAIEFGVAGLITKNSEAIKSKGIKILNNLVNPKNTQHPSG